MYEVQNIENKIINRVETAFRTFLTVMPKKEDIAKIETKFTELWKAELTGKVSKAIV